MKENTFCAAVLFKHLCVMCKTYVPNFKTDLSLGSEIMCSKLELHLHNRPKYLLASSELLMLKNNKVDLSSSLTLIKLMCKSLSHSISNKNENFLK